MLDAPDEVLERAGDHAHVFAHLDVEHDRDALHAHGGHFLVRQRDGLGARPHKAGHAARVAHDVPGARVHDQVLHRTAALFRRTLFLDHVHHHLDHDVAGVDLALRHLALAVGQDLDGLLRGIFHLEDRVLQAQVFHRFLEVFLDLVFIPGIGMDNVPLCFLIHGAYPRLMLSSAPIPDEKPRSST